MPAVKQHRQVMSSKCGATETLIGVCCCLANHSRTMARGLTMCSPRNDQIDWSPRSLATVCRMPTNKSVLLPHATAAQVRASFPSASTFILLSFSRAHIGAPAAAEPQALATDACTPHKQTPPLSFLSAPQAAVQAHVERQANWLHRRTREPLRWRWHKQESWHSSHNANPCAGASQAGVLALLSH